MTNYFKIVHYLIAKKPNTFEFMAHKNIPYGVKLIDFYLKDQCQLDIKIEKLENCCKSKIIIEMNWNNNHL